MNKEKYIYLIASNPKLAYKYAKRNRKRFPLGEMSIIFDPEWSFYYTKNILIYRWPEAEKYIMKNKYWWERYKKYIFRYNKYK